MALKGLPPGSKCVSNIDESAVSADCITASEEGGERGVIGLDYRTLLAVNSASEG